MKKFALYGLISLIVLALAASLALHFAAQTLQAKVVEALGQESEIGQVELGWSAVEVHDLRIRGPKGWPADDTLRASHIRIEPDLRALASSQLRIKRIVVDDAYLSVLRPARGPIRLLPSLLEKPPAPPADQPGAPSPNVTLGEVVLNDAVLEFFDASVSKPAHKLRLEQLNASVANLSVPALAGRTELKLAGVIKGVQGDGTVSISGWSELASKDSELQTELANVDLLALKPYLIKAADTGIRRGKLSVSLHSSVKQQRLHAPGQLKLANLELESTGGAMSSLMGLPRSAVVGALKDKQGVISMQFVLDGKLDDPQFSLNEQFAKRFGAGLAESLGVSMQGLAKGVGNAAEGVKNSVKKLFGK